LNQYRIQNRMNRFSVKWISLISFFLPLLLWAQNPMNKGFQLLEKNQYQEAEQFFETILETEPKNKTARICYGRALGLGGQVEPAYQIFQQLEQDYPGDTEVLLNLAESLMWQQSFVAASQLYTELLQKDSLLFTALLGNANAHAAQKKYPQALSLIENALQVDPGNGSARISRKYILLGAADQEKNRQNYGQAENHLTQLLADFAHDRDVRLFEAGLYLSQQRHEEAQAVFQFLLDQGLDVYRAYNGLAYTSILLNKKEQSLAYADRAIAHWRANPEKVDQPLPALVSRINALGALRRFKEADQFIDSLLRVMGPQLALDMAKARMKVWQGDFENGKAQYLSLIEAHGLSFDLQMGLVESLRAMHQTDQALAALDTALTISPSQPDARRLRKQMQLADQPLIRFALDYLLDSGGNRALNENVSYTFARKGALRPLVQAQNRDVGLLSPFPGASQVQVMAGTQWQIKPRLELMALLGGTRFQAADNVPKVAPLADLRLKAHPGRYHHLELQLLQDIHNYTASLTQLGIRRTDLVGSYNFAIPASFGLYAQYRRTYQSDQNLRHLLFASLYYDWRDQPLLKTGVNLNLFGFSRQEPLLYFSPVISKSAEVFVQLSKQNPKSGTLSYHALLALGRQKIETNSGQLTYRGELKLAYRQSENLQIRLAISGGNSVQTSIQGYAFLLGGLELVYRLPVK
jgi:tetratricopeptide (TPR) repeat protein